MGSSATRRITLAGLGLLGVVVGAQTASADIKIEERTTGLDSTVTRWTFVKGDKRSIVTRAETTGTLYNAGARYGAHVEIARPDKELIWEIDPQERSYREVTFQQLGRLVQKGVQAPRDPNEQPLRSLYSSQTTAIEVVPTGETKRIAGFQAEQVMARVVVGVQNLISGNKFSFTFDQEIWLTKDERIMREIEPFETAYVETFGTALSLSQAQVTASEWNDAFITHLRAVNDRVRALKGYPLATTTTVTEESIAQNKGEKGTKRKLSVASTEVRKVSLDTLPESEFELPAGYINADTKVAVAPRGNGAGTVAAVTPQPMTPVVKNDVPPPAVPPAMGTEKPTPPLVAKNDAPVPAKNDATAARTDVNPAPPVSPSGNEKPVAVAATGNSGDGSSDSRPNRPVVTSPPTNVVVPGANNAVASAPPRTERKPRGEAPQPALVTGYAPPAIANNYPVLSLGLSRTQAPPPPVVIDEPFALRKKKKR